MWVHYPLFDVLLTRRDCHEAETKLRGEPPHIYVLRMISAAHDRQIFMLKCCSCMDSHLPSSLVSAYRISVEVRHLLSNGNGLLMRRCL
ncbi:hypothetical protein NPIL_523521 [Nephila pilipes]|uniref:Uncharacterized protein n=1 Tax=Nephila pilipes TaxID=299642 RepID=A0A8X6PGW2_NEPPI|nr:hypothetical protein NPIL_523521 [Nephila pilipes]